MAYHLAPEAFAEAKDTPSGEGAAGPPPQQDRPAQPPASGRYSPEDAYVTLYVALPAAVFGGADEAKARGRLRLVGSSSGQLAPDL